MKKTIFLAMFLIISLYYPLNIGSSELPQTQKFEMLSKYKWMTESLYMLYRQRSYFYKVPLKLAISVVRAESNGKIVKSRSNKNGTCDWGRFQINSVHMPKNPQKLLDDKVNSKYGFWYLSLCLKKSNGNIKTAIRLYNQGTNGKAYKYKNWNYVRKVLRYYKNS